MARPKIHYDTTRKSVTLENALWDAITRERKMWNGDVPSEAEAIRILLHEAIAAREKRRLNLP
jgi:hypothetical protein